MRRQLTRFDMAKVEMLYRKSRPMRKNTTAGLQWEGRGENTT